MNNPEDVQKKSDIFKENYSLIQAKILNNLGCLYAEYGHFQAAENMFSKSLTFYEKHYSEKNLQMLSVVICYFKDCRGVTIASTMCNIVNIWMLEKSWEKSLSMLQKALAVCRLDQ